MATEYNNPKMVMDNLVLYLDAANTKSYPGSGTWNDISGKGHTATINGATYNSDKGGCFIFDGANDYATITDSSDFLFGTGSFTEEAWHKRGGNASWETPITRGSSNSWGGLWTSNSGNFYPYHYTESSGTVTLQTGDAAGTDWMHHMTTTTNTGSSVTIKIYKNGVLLDSGTTSVSGWQPKNTSVGTDLNIGGIFGANYWYEGRIGLIRIYKGKALSAAEVKQNYNAHKARFGL